MSQGAIDRSRASDRSNTLAQLNNLTQDARRVMDFLPGMRRQDTIATRGSITSIAPRLKQVAVKFDNEYARIRKHIEAEIAAPHEELDQLDTGQRPRGLTPPAATTKPAPSRCRWNAS